MTVSSHRLCMGAARSLSPVASQSPLADPASRKREVDALRHTLDALRNPAGAVRLAVQMLAGPLRSVLAGADPGQASQVEAVLGALETATSELTQLLSPLTITAPSGDAEVISMPQAATCMGEILEGARRTLKRQTRLEHQVVVSAAPGLRPHVSAVDLQTALVGLLHNALEASARRRPADGPWQVELRVTLEPAEDLGDELAVVFEVRDRGDGLPQTVLAWLDDRQCLPANDTLEGPGMSLQLARRVAEGAGGHLCARRVGGETRVRLSVPQE